ncbi:MAG: Hsp20/alpha crystallin family protein [Bacteroidota bacterium]|nr:Hsp20/alpha crystallin family protein [Bacteroidota bacterium]
MTNIIKKDNARTATFGSVVDQLFQNNLNRFFDDDYWGFNGLASRNQAPVNIRETEKSFEIELMAPGLNKEDFQLQVSNGTLTISNESQQSTQSGGQQEGWLRREFKRQSFSRSFTLDDTVDADNISARYEGGVLYLSLPKKEQAQKISRKINVQ